MQKLHGLIATIAVVASVSPLAAQPVLLFGHSGIPNGIPNPCATPTISSVQSGRWDQPSTWSGNRVPQGGDRVMVAAGTSVQYTTVTDVKPTCVNIDGALRFSTTTSTRLRVGTLIVLENGTLEIGTPAQPVAAGATAELFLAGLPFDAADPEQFWGGLIAIGRVTMHGAPLGQTFARLAAEPTSGQNTVTLAAPVAGWRVGDEIVVPDTRSLTDNERFSGLRPRTNAPESRPSAVRRSRSTGLGHLRTQGRGTPAEKCMDLPARRQREPQRQDPLRRTGGSSRPHDVHPSGTSRSALRRTARSRPHHECRIGTDDQSARSIPATHPPPHGPGERGKQRLSIPARRERHGRRTEVAADRPQQPLRPDQGQRGGVRSGSRVRRPKTATRARTNSPATSAWRSPATPIPATRTGATALSSGSTASTTS